MMQSPPRELDDYISQTSDRADVRDGSRKQAYEPCELCDRYRRFLQFRGGAPGHSHTE
jgi:hypothetical protein